MRILYDYQIFSLQKYGGISRYFFELMNYSYETKIFEFIFPIKFSNNEILKNASFSNHKTFFPNISLGIKNNYIKKLNKENKDVCLRAIELKNYDLIHPTYYNPYFLDKLGTKPFVITIHDMIYERFPELFSQSDQTAQYKKLLANKAEKIIAVSNNTKKDIMKYYKIDEKKILVTHLGNSLHVDENFVYSKDLKLPEKYILFVGSRKSYKNFDTLLKSIKLVFQENEEIHLVCAGGGKFNKYEKYQIEELGLKKRVKYYSVNDSLLAYLYSNAILFIFPSLYEGFGIPILEAFSNECPVILSNSSSFPEVAGSAALYFDPYSISSIKNSILTLLSDNSLREKMKLQGIKQLTNFSWHKTATRTKAIYDNIFKI